VLTEEERQLERVLLLTRLSTGCPVAELGEAGRAAAARAVDDGLACKQELLGGRVVLTRRGRLLADRVIADLTG
jgi:oxygen-independent coproporphyrinogen-3 oxidase